MKKGGFLLETIKTLAASLVIVVILINFVLIPCIVEGSSMYPTLEAGEFGYSFIISKNLGLKRFDVVVIKVEDSGKEKLLVKRLIGLPGEKIEYKDNQLYIDGVATQETFLHDVYTSDYEIKLKDDEYFCLGDNRGISRDSRYYGPFSNRDIRSSHLFVIYPFTSFGLK